jgi:hypothetical protein
MNKKYALIVLILLSKISFASNPDSLKYAKRFYIYWGYNRSFYSNSNVHLKGNNFDLTFFQVKAKDKPYPFNLKNYIDPVSIWVPQYNYRIGFFINDKVSISIGLDHMKYVVDRSQTAVVSGSTVGSHFPDQAKFDSVFVGKSMPLNGFMYMDHTNGLNLISFDIDYRSSIYKKKNIEINLKSGLGIAEMVTKSELHLMGYGVDNEFNLCGFGVSAYQGVELVIGKYFFIRPQVRFGWINLTGFLLNGRYDAGRGYQNFAFVDGMVVAGSYINILKRKK